MIVILAQENPGRVIYDVLAGHGSGYYYHAAGDGETLSRKARIALAAEWPTYGYR